MGISGSGKGTLISNIEAGAFPDIHIPLSYKTRPRRENEKNGIHAHFISKEQFFQDVKNGDFLEFALVHDLDYYGTKLADVLDNGVYQWKIVIKELDVNGLESLRTEHPELYSLYTTIFLYIPDDVLVKRIEERGAFMSDEELQKRLASALYEEHKAVEICDYIIDATQSKEAVLKEVLEIMKLIK